MVFWASDVEGDGWKKRRRGQFSVFSKHTRKAAKDFGVRSANMWKQHSVFAPDAIMWLGFDMKPGKSDTEMTFPKGSPKSWAYAKELFAEVHASGGSRCVATSDGTKPVATLAVLRPYSTRAICCAQGVGWDSWRNQADRILEAYVRAWSVDNGLFYDVFEIPPHESNAERVAREKRLEKYKFIVSTLPYRGARVIGMGTEGTVMTARELAALRKKFAVEIAHIVSSGRK